MNEDKLKELEKECLDTKDSWWGEYHKTPNLIDSPLNVIDTLDLIKYVRQLEKDKADWESDYALLDKVRYSLEQAKTELLAALKDIRDIAEGDWHWGNKRIMEIADPLYNKHKGE